MQESLFNHSKNHQSEYLISILRGKQNYSKVKFFMISTIRLLTFFWLNVNCYQRVTFSLDAVLSLVGVFWAVLHCRDGDCGLERSRVQRGPSCQLSSIPSASSISPPSGAQSISPFLGGPVTKIASAQSVIIANYQIHRPHLRLSSLN